jgi:hypothetical protein
MPFFSNNRKKTGLAVNKEIKVLVLGKSGIFIYFRPRDLDFPRITELRLSPFPEKGLKKNNISWERD